MSEMAPDQYPETAVEAIPVPEPDEPMLALVRYGLAKEIQLYSDAFVFVSREEGEADRIPFDQIQRLMLQPGERIPSKLIIMLELVGDTTIIVGEGMTNVRDFLRMLPLLYEVAPHIQLDPLDMDEQLQQAVRNRRQSNSGCYIFVLLSIVLVVVVCALGNLITHH